MAVKRRSAFDQALIEAQTIGGADNQPPTPAPAVPIEAAEPVPLTPATAIKNAVVEPSSSNQDAGDKKKGGRPKGEPKTKKTFYLGTSNDLLQRSQLGIAQQLGVFIRDESQIADLAFTLLDHLLTTGSPAEKQKILEAYQRLKR